MRSAAAILDAWIDPCGSDTGAGIIAALEAAGYVVVDAERFRIARKGFVDLTEAWAELRMDTEKDQALHDRLVATSRVSAALLPEVTA